MRKGKRKRKGEVSRSGTTDLRRNLQNTVAGNRNSGEQKLRASGHDSSWEERGNGAEGEGYKKEETGH